MPIKGLEVLEWAKSRQPTQGRHRYRKRSGYFERALRAGVDAYS